MDKMKTMVAMLRNKPMGSGMAQQAADKLQTVPQYREYQLSKMEMGEKPVSLEEFMKGMR